LDWFNPQSNFYLSLHVSYPNAADRVLGSKQNLGGDIFLHGNCVTTGCILITDGGIKEVYWWRSWCALRDNSTFRLTFSLRA
jgi:murein L,D-transpeptidase YafK